jgi:thioredoxin 1
VHVLRMERLLMGTQVLYFTAPWCGPCRTFGPLLTRVTTELGLPLVRLDVEEHGDMAEEFGVQSLPTVVVMTDGHEATRLVGAQSESAVRSALS